jgi:hypothetical protein
VTDRLADPELTAKLRPGVRLVDAGTPPGAHQPSQEAIGETLVLCSLADLAGAEVPPRIDNPAVVDIGPTVPVLRPDGLDDSGGPW